MATNRVSPKKGKVVDIPASVVTIGTPTAGDAQVSVEFTATSPSIGGPVQKYIAVSNPDSITSTGSASPIIVTGLTNSTAYTFTVAAGNATGYGEYSSASASATPAIQTSFDSIATLSGTGSSGTITFSSIPSTYTHLQIRAVAPVGNYITGKLNFNSDTSSNYIRHSLLGNGGGTAQGTNSGTSQTYIQLGADNGFGRSSYPYNMIIDILDYANTSKNKTMRMLAGFDSNNADGGESMMQSGLWLSTSAINTITFGLTSGNYPTTAKFALYGIKGA